MTLPQPPENIANVLKTGTVIPAHPLALTNARKLDERRQRSLTRYYLHAGCGGIAIAVHTTQFEIRLPEVGLFKPVLELASEEIDHFVRTNNTPVVKIAGAIGPTAQAVAEARLAADLGYHAVLLSLAAFKHASNDVMLDHCREVASVMPLVGFYLQPAVGGRKLDVDFWRRFAQIENVVAIKMAPFNRYQTLDVVRGVMESGRENEIALYTGNDDNIVADLITEYAIPIDGHIHRKRIVGGLLGHWSVWARSAVTLLDDIKQAANLSELLSRGVKVTDTNAAFFDVAHDFAGCIVGLHEVLRRQGLMEGVWTLNPNDVLTNAQKAGIDRVYAAYPELNDDAFVAAHLDEWLA